MWEQTLSVSSNESAMLNYIYSKISSQVKFVGGLIIKVNLKGRSKLTLAVPKKQKDYFVLLLLELISEVITIKYKSEFIFNNVRLTLGDNLTQSALISALAVFDKQTDKDIIKKNLILESELNLDRFYYFKLGLLRDRWSEICSLVENNSINLKLTNSGLNLIKFLVQTSEINSFEVHLFKDNDKLVIADSNFVPLTLLDEISSLNESNIVSNLIELSPAKIVIHNLNENRLISCLESIFENRVMVVEK
ncbi:MAG: putative sporulation protein YtxC [bacterium]|nr:putative sporulation protein YtxC [bacterium]